MEAFGFTTTAIPGHTGSCEGAHSEADARARAYDYAQLLLGNDDARQRVEVGIYAVCWACDGAGSYPVKRKRSLYSARKPCRVCRADALEIAAYAVTRE